MSRLARMSPCRAIRRLLRHDARDLGSRNNADRHPCAIRSAISAPGDSFVHGRATLPCSRFPMP
jgi:hypothetical protein